MKSKLQKIPDHEINKQYTRPAFQLT